MLELRYLPWIIWVRFVKTRVIARAGCDRNVHFPVGKSGFQFLGEANIWVRLVKTSLSGSTPGVLPHSAFRLSPFTFPFIWVRFVVQRIVLFCNPLQIRYLLFDIWVRLVKTWIGWPAKNAKYTKGKTDKMRGVKREASSVERETQANL